MVATNCPRCGKVFMKSFEAICKNCSKELEAQYEDVRAYVKENPKRSIKEVSDATGVSVKRILQYVRDGKLEASAGIQSDVTCSRCNTPILTGRMCTTCILEMGAEIVSGKPKPKPEQKDVNIKMFTR